LKYSVLIITIIITILVGATAGYTLAMSNVVVKTQSQTNTVTYTQTVVVVSEKSVAAQTEIVNGGAETSSVLSDSGLELTLSLNATTIKVGQELNITVSLSNALNRTNVVQISNSSVFLGVPVALWPPCYFSLPVQMIVIHGSYDLRNLSKVANTPFDYGCMEGWNVDHVIFQPSSDEANLTGIYNVDNSNQSLGPFHLTENFTTDGYWDLQNLSKELNTPIIGEYQYPPRPPDYIFFVPGEYTIAAEDEWGQVVVLHVTCI